MKAPWYMKIERVESKDDGIKVRFKFSRLWLYWQYIKHFFTV